jgi:hypothetical protein
MPSFVFMLPHPRYFTPVGFLSLDVAQRFVGRRADDAFFWDELLGARWIDTHALIASHDLFIDDDDIVRLEPVARDRATDSVDTAEEAEFRAMEWKPNDKGLPGRRMAADYIMRKDPNAQRAYNEMRTNLRLSHEEAELRIERVFDANFRTVLLSKENEKTDDVDRRPDMWIELARGFSVEAIFPNLEELGMLRRDGPLQ